MPIVGEDLYPRLFAELDAGRYEAPEVVAAIEQLGAHGHLFRGFARARRQAWASVRTDVLAACTEHVEPLTEYLGGVALIVARDYDRGLGMLGRAADSSNEAVSSYSAKLFAKFARELGWIDESRAMLDRIASRLAAGDLEGRQQALRRRSGVQQRDQDALLGTDPDVAAKAWARVFVDGVAAASGSVAALIERRGERAELLAIQVRLDLLAGELERARARLERVEGRVLVAERIACVLALGQLEEALALALAPSDQVSEESEPRLLHLRGEVLLRVEQYADAAVVLERARIALPQSNAIALALALARHFEDPGTPGTEFEHRFTDLLERMPALLVDAAEAIGCSVWTDEGPNPSRTERARVLVEAHAMLTAERDSLRSHYRRQDRPLRQVLPAWAPQLGRGSHFAQLHANDLRWIDKVQSTLVSAIGIDPRGPAHSSAREPGNPMVWQPRFLSTEQIERFVTDGYLMVPRAFEPELAARWREDANHRLRDAPELWVRGYDPTDQARSLRDYSPSDPATWTWPRLVLEGNETVVVEAFAPDAWAAICDLLGGPARIKTQVWNNYLNLNFFDPGGDRAEGQSDRPLPESSGWHIDDPHPAMRIDRIETGLICIALFDRVLPESGSTWLCPESVGRISRELGDHPAGVDFVHDRGARIAKLCSLFHEVVGEAGDILLMHPLMLHSAAGNRSGRIRWMGNPLIYMNRPLDPLRTNFAELSPVELAMRRALW